MKSRDTSHDVAPRPRSDDDPRPYWWNPKTTKMLLGIWTVGLVSLTTPRQRARLLVQKMPKNIYLVEWRLCHTINAREIEDNGRRYFTPEQLAAAFRLNNLTGDNGDHLLQQYGGHSAEAGLYIRYDDYLNIPGPGTGQDGDPNLSILIRGTFRNSIEKLLE